MDNTTSKNAHTFSFFVGDKTPSDIADKDNSYVEYIIYQNDMLHTKNRTLEDELFFVKTERDTYIEENERYEKSVTGLRGMAINEYEMSRMLEKVIDGYRELVRSQHKEVLTMTKMIGLYLIAVGMIFVLMLAGHNIFWIFWTLNIGYMGSVVYVRKTFWNTNTPKIPIKYQEKMDEYEKLRKNQDYIKQLVDNM